MNYKYYKTANNIFRISRADLGYRIEYLYTYAKSEHAPTPTTWLKAYNGIQYIPELITKGAKISQTDIDKLLMMRELMG